MTVLQRRKPKSLSKYKKMVSAFWHKSRAVYVPQTGRDLERLTGANADDVRTLINLGFIKRYGTVDKDTILEITEDGKEYLEG